MRVETWVDEEVILSNGGVTSRNPDDIPGFNRELINLFSKAAGGRGESERKVA
jgi:protease I